MPRDTRSSDNVRSIYIDSPSSSVQVAYANDTMSSLSYHTYSWDRPRTTKVSYKEVKDMYPNFQLGPFSIKVCNLRTLSKEQRTHMEPYQIIVDRSTPLGNPFHMPRKEDGSLDEDMRDTVLIQYQNYFYDMVRAFGKFGRGLAGLPRDAFIALKDFSSERLNGKYSPAQTGYLFIRWLRYIYKALVQYGRVELWDWCAPKHCHAETIVKYLLHYYGKLYNAHERYQYKLVHESIRHAQSESREPDSSLAHRIEGLGACIANPESATIRVNTDDTECERESVRMPEEVDRYMQQRLHDLGVPESETDVYCSEDSEECCEDSEERPEPEYIDSSY